jgi:hypothetical protein|tara:strand:- start:7204 stop:7431 length:228 start_codon:yes stop_codon:yes gene_type:complete
MVLSGSKRTASIASIVNQDSKGGSKKAGLAYQVGRDSNSSIAIRGSSQNYAFLKTTANPNVSQSRPIGVSPMVWR